MWNVSGNLAAYACTVELHRSWEVWEWDWRSFVCIWGGHASTKTLTLVCVMQICLRRKAWLSDLLATEVHQRIWLTCFCTVIFGCICKFACLKSACLLIYWSMFFFARTSFDVLWLWVMKCLRTSHSDNSVVRLHTGSGEKVQTVR